MRYFHNFPEIFVNLSYILGHTIIIEILIIFDRYKLTIAFWTSDSDMTGFSESGTPNFGLGLSESENSSYRTRPQFGLDQSGGFGLRTSGIRRNARLKLTALTDGDTALTTGTKEIFVFVFIFFILLFLTLDLLILRVIVLIWWWSMNLMLKFNIYIYIYIIFVDIY